MGHVAGMLVSYSSFVNPLTKKTIIWREKHVRISLFVSNPPMENQPFWEYFLEYVSSRRVLKGVLDNMLLQVCKKWNLQDQAKQVSQWNSAIKLNNLSFPALAEGLASPLHPLKRVKKLLYST